LSKVAGIVPERTMDVKDTQLNDHSSRGSAWPGLLALYR